MQYFSSRYGQVAGGGLRHLLGEHVEEGDSPDPDDGKHLLRHHAVPLRQAVLAGLFELDGARTSRTRSCCRAYYVQGLDRMLTAQHCI